MWLRCKNQGEIELNAFKLLGACTKREDSSKIGFFGTGLKYAISVFMREGVLIRCFSGEREIKLGTVDDKLRDLIFKVITIDGERTSLTTDTGIKWTVWQAVRESVCNALDEGGVNSLVKDVVPAAGETHIYIDATSPKVKEVTDNWNMYFAHTREEIYECDYGHVLEAIGPKANIYKKGIRAYGSSFESTYDYDLKFGELGEDRVMSYFDMIYYVSKCFNNPPIPVILKFASLWKVAFSEIFERTIDGNYIDPGRNWVLALKGKQVLAHDFAGTYPETAQSETSIILPTKLVNKLIELYQDEIEFVTGKFNIYHKYTEMAATKRQSEMLDKSLMFLKTCSLYHDEQIKIGKFLKNTTMPLITDEGTIVLPDTTFNFGTKMLATHILQAVIALQKDDSLAANYVTLLEEKYNTYL